MAASLRVRLGAVLPFFMKEWHDFFLVSGGATGTLIGLLFVALLVNKDSIAHEPIFRSLARQTNLALMSVLVVSRLGLVPETQVPVRWMGAILFVLALSNLASSLLIYVRTTREHHRKTGASAARGRGRADQSARNYLVKAALYSLALLMIAGAGTFLWRDDLRGMVALVPAIFVLGGLAVANSWALVMRVVD